VKAGYGMIVRVWRVILGKWEVGGEGEWRFKGDGGRGVCELGWVWGGCVRLGLIPATSAFVGTYQDSWGEFRPVGVCGLPGPRVRGILRLRL